MTLLIITIIAVIIWRFIRHWFNPENDGLGPLVGYAKSYAGCPNCGKRNCQSPRGRGEVITRGGNYVARQYHVCINCDTKSLWHRRLDLWVWTINRNGVA